MLDLFVAILGIFGLIILYAFLSPLLFMIGKFFLRLITLNRFPPENPNDKDISNTVGGGLLVLILLFVIFVILKNYFF